jgi:hypothetical protein
MRQGHANFFHARLLVGIFVGTRWINILPRHGSFSGKLLDMVAAGPTMKSIAVQSPVCGRGGLSPQVSAKVPSSSERAACIAANAEKLDKNRGQLLSFLFAVAPNRTMSL